MDQATPQKKYILACCTEFNNTKRRQQLKPTQLNVQDQKKIMCKIIRREKIIYLRYYGICGSLCSYVTTQKKKLVFIRQYQENKFSVVLYTRVVPKVMSNNFL
jgi:hypothetical protein